MSRNIYNFRQNFYTELKYIILGSLILLPLITISRLE